MYRKIVSATGLTLGGHFSPKSRHQPNELRDVGETVQEENSTKSSIHVRARVYNGQ